MSSTAPVVVSRIQNRRGTQDQFDNLYPIGYDGVGGFGSIPGYTSTNFPNVLMPGELALCTDSRNIYMGNINGEFLLVNQIPIPNDVLLLPLSIVLAPAPTFTVIPELTYSATPFMTMLYSLTDSASADWNSVGTNFSRNGELQITSLSTPTTTLTDIGTEINSVSPKSISFISQYSGANVEILYRHDFSSSLKFNTSSIKWIEY